MSILVIGRSGQVAQSLLKAQPAGAAGILALGRPDVDLASPVALQAAVAAYDPRVIINAAAYTAVDRAETDADTAFAVNGDGAGYLAAICAARDVPLIHLSTDYVFDGWLERAYREDDATGPLNTYGASKLAGEQAIRQATPHHLILRTSWVFSPFGHNFVRSMLRLAEERDELRVVADQLGTPTYACDLAEAILALAKRAVETERGSFPWGTYHMAGSGTASWFDLACRTFEVSTRYGMQVPRVERIETKEYPTPAARPMNSRLSCKKLEQTFQLRLPDWHDAVDRCVAAFVDAGKRPQQRQKEEVA